MSQATKEIKEAAIPRPPIVKHIAPPYMGAGLGAVPSPNVPPTFWKAIRHDVTRGGLVVQLGAQANAPIGSYATASAGFQYEFTAPVNPPFYTYYVFQAKFNTGPVSANRNGGNIVNTFCEIQLLGNNPKRLLVTSNTPATLYTDHSLEPTVTYRVQVRCGVTILRLNSSYIPYGEVIIKDLDLEMTRYYDGDNALQTGTAQAAALLSQEVIVESVASIEEAQEKGLVGMF